jgi:hypothetical protein
MKDLTKIEKPQPKPIVEPATEYSTQDEINAALRHWQATRTENGSDYAALKRLIALRVPS